jgi:hypothetical protein
LLKEGYAVGPKSEMQSRPMDRVPERQRPGPGDRRAPADRRFVRKGPGRRGNDRPGGGGPDRPGGNGPRNGPRGPRPGGGGKPKA